MLEIKKLFIILKLYGQRTPKKGLCVVRGKKAKILSNLKFVSNRGYPYFFVMNFSAIVDLLNYLILEF